MAHQPREQQNPKLLSTATRCAMAKDDYIVATGGSLKLKGVKDAKVDKKKKKKKAKAGDTPEPTSTPSADSGAPPDAETNRNDDDGSGSREVGSGTEIIPEDGPSVGKTETERRHEEMKRKRVCELGWACNAHAARCSSDLDSQLNERIKREGVKTHKERVEDLNKYLSNLSEHHDM